MSDNNFGYKTCYICGYPLDPLTSNCPDCGYSQLPDKRKPGGLKQEQQDRRDSLKSKLEQKKADYKARLKKK